MALTMPTISSLLTFMARAKAWWGALFMKAAAMRSLRPRRMPAVWGPRMILPPE